jgi:hypothetical protein
MATGTVTTEASGQDIKKGTAIDKSDAEKDSQNETIDVGNGKTHRDDKGHREAVRKEILHALEQVKSTELKKEINIPTLFYRALIHEYPEFLTTIDEFLVEPIDHDGITETSLADNLSKKAQARGVCDEYIYKKKVLALMDRMARAGTWIRRQAQGWKFKDAQIGYEDLNEMITIIVQEKGNGISKTHHKFLTDGACRFVGDYNVIQCGQCILDVSNRNGMPELICAGQKTFANGEAGGMKLAVTVAESSSIRDAQSRAQSDERYKAVSDAADNYLRFAVTRGKGFEAMTVKKRVLEKMVTNSWKVDSAVKAMQEKQDPSKIMSLLK